MTKTQVDDEETFVVLDPAERIVDAVPAIPDPVSEESTKEDTKEIPAPCPPKTLKVEISDCEEEDGGLRSGFLSLLQKNLEIFEAALSSSDDDDDDEDDDDEDDDSQEVDEEKTKSSKREEEDISKKLQEDCKKQMNSILAQMMMKTVIETKTFNRLAPKSRIFCRHNFGNTKKVKIDTNVDLNGVFRNNAGNLVTIKDSLKSALKSIKGVEKVDTSKRHSFKIEFAPFFDREKLANAVFRVLHQHETSIDPSDIAERDA